MGLVTVATMPACWQARRSSGKACAVCPSTARPGAMRCNARVACSPSITGICRSINTMSNADGSWATASTASCPLATTWTLAPSSNRASWITIWLTALSSATRKRSPANRVPGPASTGPPDGPPDLPLGGPGSGSSQGTQGRVSVNWLPWPTSLLTHSSPPIRRASCRLMVRPSPVPPNLRVVLLSPCWNGANSCAISSAPMPMPVSRTLILSCGPTSAATSSTSPLSVNLMALDSRLSSTCAMRTGSPRIAPGTPACTTLRSRRDLRAASSRNGCTAVSMILRGSSGTNSMSSLPASIFEKSRTSFRIVSSNLPESRIWAKVPCDCERPALCR